jgi:hypothetical protein
VIQTQSKGHDKKIAATEAQLKSLSQQMTFSSFKSHGIVGLLMIVVINLIGSAFSGSIVAMLPFEPVWIFKGITHRNIIGENYYECAYLFPYILTAFIWRNNIKKIFGKISFIKVSNLLNPQYPSLNPHNINLNDS